MDLETAKKWLSQPDVCRCCLSRNGTSDLNISYSNSESNESYANILKECFGISISHINPWENRSHMICEDCATQLRQADDFRNKVLTAKKLYQEYVEQNIDNDQNIGIKSEVDSDDHIETDIFTELPQEDDFTELQTLKQEKRNRNKRSQKSSQPTKSTAENNILPKDVLDININGVKTKKQLSERKKIQATCQSILQYTNACPFRHHKSWFQCFYCTEEYMEIDLLRKHIENMHKNIEKELSQLKRYPKSLQIEVTDLKCHICDENLTNLAHICEHLTNAHKCHVYTEFIADYKINKSPFTCHLCKKQFHVFRSLTTHLNVHYANCICDACGKSFLNSKRLKVHKRTHDIGVYPCNVCDKVFKTTISRANHVENVHSKRILKCHLCSASMKHYNERIKHMSEVHDITHKFTCHICHKVYNIKHYLATHIRQTHGNKNKNCTECNMSFITNHGLKKHMQKHSGQKPFKCNLCNKSFARNYTLKEHLRVHEIL